MKLKYIQKTLKSQFKLHCQRLFNIPQTHIVILSTCPSNFTFSCLLKIRNKNPFMIGFFTVAHKILASDARWLSSAVCWIEIEINTQSYYNHRLQCALSLQQLLTDQDIHIIDNETKRYSPETREKWEYRHYSP